MSLETLVTSALLQEHIDDPDWKIFDCRFSLDDTLLGENNYNAYHIPGARYAHLDKDLSSQITATSGRHPLPDVTELTRKLACWGLRSNMQVVVYDDSFGSIAARLWWLLRWLGHFSVAVLDGGFPKWQREGRPLEIRLPETQAGDLSCRYEAQSWLTTDQIEQSLQDDTICLLDARTPERFQGKQEPIDPVAGHIPGAINHPFDLNLTATGEFKSPAILRAQFAHTLGVTQSDRVVHMCGSGVTACHNLLTMEIVGLKGSMLYPGSWSEWIRDNNRPVSLITASDHTF